MIDLSWNLITFLEQYKDEFMEVKIPVFPIENQGYTLTAYVRKILYSVSCYSNYLIFPI